MHLWPQIAMLFLVSAGIGISIAKFGERKTDKYDWGDVLIAPALTLTILYFGGFFAPLGF